MKGRPGAFHEPSRGARSCRTTSDAVQNAAAVPASTLPTSQPSAHALHPEHRHRGQADQQGEPAAIAWTATSHVSGDKSLRSHSSTSLEAVVAYEAQ
jgi:hypothetical protein